MLSYNCWKDFIFILANYFFRAIFVDQSNVFLIQLQPKCCSFFKRRWVPSVDHRSLRCLDTPGNTYISKEPYFNVVWHSKIKAIFIGDHFTSDTLLNQLIISYCFLQYRTRIMSWVLILHVSMFPCIVYDLIMLIHVYVLGILINAQHAGCSFLHIVVVGVFQQ